MVNILSVDVEEYFHPSEVQPGVDRSHWDSLPSRVVDSTQRVLELLARHQVSGTFFILGWQEAQPVSAVLEPQVTVADLHARFDWRGLQARSVLVRGWLDDAGDLSDALGLTGSDRLGESFWGYYVEAAYDVLPLAYPGTRYGLLPYARFERTDTQDDVPGGTEDPANDRSTLTTGLALKPHPNVILKMDHQQRRTQARTGIGQWNAAIGYLF